MFVASNTVKEGGKIVPLAENIFGAVYQYIAKVHYTRHFLPQERTDTKIKEIKVTTKET